MKRNAIVTVFIMSLIISSCKREYGDYYDPPKGQKGEIYKQMAADPALSTFVAAIDKVPGLKEELSSSGLFTVMAPDNEAFKQYFAQSSSYKSIEAVPVDTLAPMIKFHIMKWMLFQIDFLNPGLTGTDYSMFKYETRATSKYKEHAASGRDLPIFYTSKMVQVYTPNFFSNFGVTAKDYSDVYGAGASLNAKTKMNIMGASVKQTDITGGNGVYYVIDKVIQPPLSIAQELDNNPEYLEYNQLLKKSFLSYSYNKAGTFAQGNNGDVNNDGLVDSLWVRNYSTDANLDNENPMSASKKSLLSLSAFIPSRMAFSQYLNSKLLPCFSNTLDSIPKHTLLMLYQSHITNTLDWPSKIDKGYVTNILGDRLSELTRNDVISTKMTSNGLFYCLNKVIEPKAFNAVTGPAFFASKYWYFAEMLVQTGLISSLTSKDVAYTIFAPTNSAFNKRSIIWDPAPLIGKPGFFKIKAGVNPTAITVAEMSSIIGNHIMVNNGMSASNMADGFYPAQNTSFIVVEKGKIYGSERDSIPEIIEPDIKMSNGYFHGIDKVMINPQKSIFDLINMTNATSTPKITPQYLKFKELCSAAGILAKDFGTITLVDANKKFTVFIPSNEAIIAAQVAGKLPKTGAQGTTSLTAADKLRLTAYLKCFFVPEKQILTDGKLTGTFLTSKLDAASTPGNDVFVPITVSLPILTVTEQGTSAKVDLSQPLIYPQNMLCKDGVVQIIDNAFTSQY